MIKSTRLLGLAIAACAAVAMAHLPAIAADTSLDGNLRGNCSTAIASSGAATLNNKCGIITTEVLTTLKDSEYTLTLTDSVIAAADIVLASVQNALNTAGEPIITRITPAAGSVAIVVKNYVNGPLGTGASFNNTLKITYLVIKP